MRGLKTLLGTTAFCWAWQLRQLPRRRLPLISAFNLFVRTAITTTRHTAARPWAFTGRATSTTASSWAWARGPAGVMATAGAVIASLKQAAEAIAAVAVQRPTAATTQRRRHALERCIPTRQLPIPAGRVPARLTQQRHMAHPTLRPLTQPHHTPKADMKAAANTSSEQPQYNLV